jgi:hypothetical protein
MRRTRKAGLFLQFVANGGAYGFVEKEGLESLHCRRCGVVRITGSIPTARVFLEGHCSTLCATYHESSVRLRPSTL